MAQYLDKEGLEKALSVVKEYVDTLSDSKQDAFTVGTGLQLSDGVLSSTLDTTIFTYVSSLPSSPDSNKIYVLKSTSDESETGNLYEEYYWNTTDSAWEKIGSFNAPSVDVSVAVSNIYGINIGDITVDDTTFGFYVPKVNFAPTITSGTLLGYLQYSYGTPASLGTYERAIYAPTTDLSDYYTQSETDDAIAAAQYWSLSSDTLSNTDGSTVSISDDLSVGGTIYANKILHAADQNIVVCSAESDGTYTLILGSDKRPAGQSTDHKVYLGNIVSTNSSITYIGCLQAAGTGKVRIGQNDSSGSSYVDICTGSGSGGKYVTFASSSYPLNTFRVYADAAYFYGTTTFKSVAYGVTPDSDSNTNELATTEWVRDVAEIYITNNVTAEVTNYVSSVLTWVELD